MPRLGDKKIDRLRPDDFDRLYVELRKYLGAASVLKIHTILRSALSAGGAVADALREPGRARDAAPAGDAADPPADP